MRRFAAALLLLSACASTSTNAAPASPHPLDPLTRAEIERAVALLRRDKPIGRDGVFLPCLALREPSKEALARGGAIPRQADAVVLDRRSRETFEAVVDLDAGGVRWTPRPGAHPNVMLPEFEEAGEIVRKDPAWLRAVEARGLKPDDVHLDTWAAGVVPVPGAAAGARLCRAIAFLKEGASNPYGRPVEGLVAVVDVGLGKVVQVLDSGARPVAPPTRTIRPWTAPSLPSPAANPRLRIDGHRVRWQNWDFRFSMHPREGLVLHAVGYAQGGRVRPILHRASIAEMVVPYGDPDPAWVWRAAFDEGEYGLGRLANTLLPGGDVPAGARFAGVAVVDELGKAETRERTLAFYERDGGILHKHAHEDGETWLRRARQLVVMHAVTVGNYDYFIHWIFHEDGALESRVEASGILLAKGVKQHQCLSCKGQADPDERTGTLVAPGIVAPNHQHLFSFRLDFDVDGPVNRLHEVNVDPLPEAENPSLNGFRMEKTPLRSELAAKRDLDLKRHRHWKVSNPGARNALGHDPGYLLIPGENSAPYPVPGAAARKRAAFMEHHVWATAFREGERYAAGEYPNQNPESDGLPRWTSDDEPIEDRDLVLWYTVGLTHVPRPEEWPIMPTAGVSFKLLPAAFFLENPALDLPE